MFIYSFLHLIMYVLRYNLNYRTLNYISSFDVLSIDGELLMVVIKPLNTRMNFYFFLKQEKRKGKTQTSNKSFSLDTLCQPQTRN